MEPDSWVLFLDELHSWTAPSMDKHRVKESLIWGFRTLLFMASTDSIRLWICYGNGLFLLDCVVLVFLASFPALTVGEGALSTFG